MPGCHGIAGCHCWVRCHCWAPLLGATAWAPLFGAIAGCHCWVPLLGAVAGVPLLGAIVGCHGWMPLLVPLLRAIAREKIDQSVTPFSAALFSALITHKLACAIWGLCWYNLNDFVPVCLGRLRGKCSKPPRLLLL